MESITRLDTSTKSAQVNTATTPVYETFEQPRIFKQASWIQKWSPTGLMVAYFIFSISLYTILDSSATKVFWFLFLTIATLKAGITALEAYDGLTPLREARKAVKKAEDAKSKSPENEDDLPLVHLIFDSIDAGNTGLTTEVLESIQYPREKLAVTFLRSSPTVLQAPVIDHMGYHHSSRVRMLTIPARSARSLAARLACCLSPSIPQLDACFTAVFSGNECSHPDAIKAAVQRLVQDTKLDIVNGRKILVPRTRRFGFSTVATLLQDMVAALSQPGSAMTWDLKRANETTAVWRTEALLGVAGASAGFSEDGFDLGWSAVAGRCRAAFDLRLISYAPGPRTAIECWTILASDARKAAVSAPRYFGLAFANVRSRKQRSEQKLTFKTRIGVIYTLLARPLVSHTILQYFCLALSALFTSAPRSASDLARKIYWQHPVSEWLIILGLISLAATAAMICKARSEFVPTYTALIVALAYPFIVLLQAGVDVYGQAEAVLRAPRR